MKVEQARPSGATLNVIAYVRIAVPFPRRDNRLTPVFEAKVSGVLYCVIPSRRRMTGSSIDRYWRPPTFWETWPRGGAIAPLAILISSTILLITLLVPSSSPTPVMSQTPAESAASAASSSSTSNFQTVFQAALKFYKKQTKKDLLTHPLASQLQSCESATAILAILQGQVREFEKSSEGDERLIKWLGPTVNVLNAFSATVSGGVSLVRLDS